MREGGEPFRCFIGWDAVFGGGCHIAYTPIRKNVLPLSRFFADTFSVGTFNYIIVYKWEKKL